MSDSEYAIRPNKTQLKREIRILNELGKALIDLPDSSLKKVPLSEQMREAIRDGKRFKRGALQRQLRRIASLMQHEDVSAIQLELERLKQPNKQQVAELHKLETWRDRLLANEEVVFNELIEEFESLDRQHLRQLVRNAINERKRNKPPKYARQVFQYLAELQAGKVNLNEFDPAAAEQISEQNFDNS